MIDCLWCADDGTQPHFTAQRARDFEFELAPLLNEGFSHFFVTIVTLKILYTCHMNNSRSNNAALDIEPY